jgi:hypothetical protein
VLNLDITLYRGCRDIRIEILALRPSRSPKLRRGAGGGGGEGSGANPPTRRYMSALFPMVRLHMPHRTGILFLFLHFATLLVGENQIVKLAFSTVAH